MATWSESARGAGPDGLVLAGPAAARPAMTARFVLLVLYLCVLFFQPQQASGALAYLRPAMTTAALALVLCVPALLRDGPWPFLRAGEGRLLLAMFAIASLSLAGAPDPQAGAAMLGMLAKSLLLFFLVAMAIDSEFLLTRFVKVMILLMTVNSTVSIWMYHTGRSGYYRMDSYFGGMMSDVNEFGIAMIIALSFAAALLPTAASLKEKAFLAFASMTFMYCITRSYSRGTFVAFVVVLALYAARHLAKPRFLLAALVVIGLLAYKTPGRYWERVGSVFNVAQIQRYLSLGGRPAGDDEAIDGAVQARLRLKQQSLGLIAEHPWLGVGIGNFSVALQRRGIDEKYSVVHNGYLEVAAETGLPNLALYVSTFLVTAVNLRRFARVRAAAGGALPAIADAAFLGLVGYAIANVFISQQYNRLFYVLVGISVILGRMPAGKGRLTGRKG